MNEREILERLGERNRHDGNKNRITPVKPRFSITGTHIGGGSHIRKGLGRFHFVVYHDSTYRPTEADLKPFLDYIKKNPPTNSIPAETTAVSTKSTPNK